MQWYNMCTIIILYRYAYEQRDILFDVHLQFQTDIKLL